MFIQLLKISKHKTHIFNDIFILNLTSVLMPDKDTEIVSTTRMQYLRKNFIPLLWEPIQYYQ